MSRIPIGVNSQQGARPRHPDPADYFARYEMTSQFEGAERIADKWGVTRDDTDRFGLASQERAARAWAEGRFDGQWVPVEAPDVGEDGNADRIDAHRARATRASARRRSRSWRR